MNEQEYVRLFKAQYQRFAARGIKPMSHDELKQVVAKIQFGDSRQVDLMILLEWQNNIGDLNFSDAIEAVTMHRRESPDYLQAAHVRANARRAKLLRERDERINAPRALTGNVITLDREKFELETQAAIEATRAAKAARG